MTQFDFVNQTLQELDGGVFASHLSHAMSEAALGVVEHGRKGKVAITFTIERIGDSHQVQLKHSISYKRPTMRGNKTEESTTSTPLFVGTGGSLTIMPEKQGKLFEEKK